MRAQQPSAILSANAIVRYPPINLPNGAQNVAPVTFFASSLRENMEAHGAALFSSRRINTETTKI